MNIWEWIGMVLMTFNLTTSDEFKPWWVSMLIIIVAAIFAMVLGEQGKKKEEVLG